MYAYEHAFSDQEAWDWLRRQQERYRTDGFGLWAVVEKNSGEMVGQCGITWQELGDGTRVPEVGYLLEKTAWHRGIRRRGGPGLPGLRHGPSGLRGGVLHHPGQQPGLPEGGPAQWDERAGLLCEALLRDGHAPHRVLCPAGGAAQTGDPGPDRRRGGPGGPNPPGGRSGGHPHRDGVRPGGQRSGPGRGGAYL